MIVINHCPSLDFFFFSSFLTWNSSGDTVHLYVPDPKPYTENCVKSILSLVFRFTTKHLVWAWSWGFAVAPSCFGEGHKRVSEGRRDSWLGVVSLSWEEVSAIRRVVCFLSHFSQAGGSLKLWKVELFDGEVRRWWEKQRWDQLWTRQDQIPSSLLIRLFVLANLPSTG